MNARPDLNTDDAEDQPFMRRKVTGTRGSLSTGSTLSVQHTVGRGMDQARLRWHCNHLATHFWRESTPPLVSILAERPALSKQLRNLRS